MRLEGFMVPAMLAIFATTPVHGEEAARYQLEKSSEGYVRLDTKTGALTLCNETSGQLVCKMAADERGAFQDEIDRLHASVKALDERVVKLETSLTARLESKLPTDEEFDKTMGYMERFLRSFMGIVKDMEKDDAGDTGKMVPQKHEFAPRPKLTVQMV